MNINNHMGFFVRHTYCIRLGIRVTSKVDFDNINQVVYFGLFQYTNHTPCVLNSSGETQAKSTKYISTNYV